MHVYDNYDTDLYTLSRYREFGDWVKTCFSRSVATTQGSGFTLKLSPLNEVPLQFDHVLISEDQSQGQLVLNFTVSAVLANSSEVIVTQGQSVGNKFVRSVQPVNATQVWLYVTEAFAIPTFLQFSLHYCNSNSTATHGSSSDYT